MPFKAKGTAEMSDWADAATWVFSFLPSKWGHISRFRAVLTSSVPSCDPMCHITDVQNTARKGVS